MQLSAFLNGHLTNIFPGIVQPSYLLVHNIEIGIPNGAFNQSDHLFILIEPFLNHLILFVEELTATLEKSVEQCLKLIFQFSFDTLIDRSGFLSTWS